MKKIELPQTLAKPISREIESAGGQFDGVVWTNESPGQIEVAIRDSTTQVVSEIIRVSVPNTLGIVDVNVERDGDRVMLNMVFVEKLGISQRARG